MEMGWPVGAADIAWSSFQRIMLALAIKRLIVERTPPAVKEPIRAVNVLLGFSTERFPSEQCRAIHEKHQKEPFAKLTPICPN
jgi:hypothetical protein